MKTPFDYGFVNGVDNTAALQAALSDPLCSWLDFTDIVGGIISDTLTLARPKKITGIKNRSSLSFTQGMAGAAKSAFVFAPGAEGSEVSGLKIDYNWGAGVTAPATFAGILGAVSVEADYITMIDVAVDGHKANSVLGARVGGVEIKASHFRVRGAKIENVAGYGVHGLTWVSPWPSALSNIVLEDVEVTSIGDGAGILIQNMSGNVSRIKLLRCRVDISDEPATSVKNAIYVGQLNETQLTDDVLIDGCAVVANAMPDNTTCGSITVGGVTGGRVVNNRIKGGGIGISIAHGYNNTVVGNAIDMQGAYNLAQGYIGYGIEVAGSQVACMGNSIEGRATLARGVAIQGASSIYNVNVGPNNIQGCLTRIFPQGGHPGPFRVLDP